LDIALCIITGNILSAIGINMLRQQPTVITLTGEDIVRYEEEYEEREREREAAFVRAQMENQNTNATKSTTAASTQPVKSTNDRIMGASSAS
jgi:hypothetical protein